MKEFNEQEIGNEFEALEPAIGSAPDDTIQNKPGWKTSSGIITTVSVVLAWAFAFTKWEWAKDAMFWENVIPITVAIVGSFTALYNYVVSRGKLASNTAWANAALKMAKQPAVDGPMLAQATLFGGGNILKSVKKGLDVAKILGPLFGGKVEKIIDTSGNVGDAVLGTTPARQITDEQILEGFKSINEKLTTLSDNDAIIIEKVRDQSRRIDEMQK